MVYRILIILLIAMLNSACSGKAFVPFSTRIQVNLEASSEVNPNNDGRPSPIVIRIYELKTDAFFSSRDFFDIYDNDTESLGESLIEKREFNIKPNEANYYEKELSEDANYLGVIAAFRNIDESKWRDVVQLRKHNSNNLKIVVRQNSVAFDSDNKKN